MSVSLAGSASRGTFRCRAPHITTCAPTSEKCASQSEDCVQKKVTSPVLLECISRPPTPKYCLCPPSVSKSRSRTNTRVNAKTKRKISRRRPFFGLHPWICGQEPKSATSVSPRQVMNVASQARIVLRKKISGPYWLGLIWDKDLFFGLHSRVWEKKSTYAPKYFLCLSSHAALAPGLILSLFQPKSQLARRRETTSGVWVLVGREWKYGPIRSRF